jgi:hypothetical protein
LIGLTSLKSSGRSSTGPKPKNRRAVLVLGKIDKILAQDRAVDQERDVRFIELGCYLCEVRSSGEGSAMPRLNEPNDRGLTVERDG